LWIPQAVMPIGTLAVILSLLRSATLNFRRCRAVWR